MTRYKVVVPVETRLEEVYFVEAQSPEEARTAALYGRLTPTHTIDDPDYYERDKTRVTVKEAADGEE